MGAGRFAVHGFDDYAVKLKRAFVVLDAAEREAAIWQGAQNLAFAAGMEVVPDKGLLAEVAGLVEWPVPLMGRIGDGLPAPAARGAANLDARTPEVLLGEEPDARAGSKASSPSPTPRPPTMAQTILKGNQKVLSARLSDAKFFWENDLRVAKAGMDGMAGRAGHRDLPQQTGQPGRPHRPHRGAGARNRPLGRRRPRSGRTSRATGQGRPALGHGRRIPRTAGPDGHATTPARPACPNPWPLPPATTTRP